MRTANPNPSRRAGAFPRFRSFLPVALAVGALLVLSPACAPKTSTTEVWSADLTVRGPIRSVLVIGDGPGVTERRVLEDKLVEHLTKRGVLARPSYELFPYAIPTSEQARQAALQAGMDGILSSRLRLIEERRRNVPPTTTYFWAPQYGSYTASNAGYTVADEFVEFSTSLWEPRAGSTLWTASTTTENPQSSKGFAGSLANAVIPAMADAGLVPREP